MKKVIFIYESYLDKSAAQVLKELLGKITGNVSLCLEMPEQNIRALAETGNQVADIVKEIRELENTLSTKVTYLSKWFTVNGDKYFFDPSVYNVESIEDLSLAQANECLGKIKTDQTGIYDSISAIFDSVKLAESNGMKIYSVDQPENERPEEGPLYESRDKYMVDKLTELCGGTSDVLLFLVEYDAHHIAEMIRGNGILTA